MIKAKFSFLFFYAVITVTLLMCNTNAFGQQYTDSIEYYINLIKEPQTSNDLTTAYKYIKEAKKKSLIEKDSLKAVYCIYHIASIEYKGGFYYDSEASATEGLKLLNKMEQVPYTMYLNKAVYTLLGMLYREQNNEKVSAKMYNKAFQYAQSSIDSLTLYNNRSNIYKDTKAYLKAKNELLKAFSLIERVQDTLAIARVMDNLGYISFRLKQESSLPLMQDALNLRLEINDPKSLFPSYIHLSEYYKDRLNPKLAEDYALKALRIGNILNSASFKEQALSSLIGFSPDKYFEKYKVLNDSISLANRQSTNKFAMMKYNTSEQERLLKESELQSRKDKEKRLFYQYLIGLIVLFVVFLYVILKSKYRKDKILQVQITEARISKKIHDEVANDVYHVISKIQSDNYDVLDNLESIYNKTRDISRENSAIELDGDFNEYLNDMLLSFMNENITVITNNINKVNWSQVSKVKKMTIYRVLQELMVNMKKHSNATHTIIKFSQEFGGLFIDYKDNGNGCNLIKRGGLVNVENRIKTINGTIKFESKPSNGFYVKIKI